MTETTDSLPSDFRMEHLAEERHDASRREASSTTGITDDGNVEAVRNKSERTNDASRIGSASDIGIFYEDSLQMVVERAKRIAMKEDQGRARLEVVRLDAYLGLLKKSNDRLKRKYAELEITLSIFHRHPLCAANSNQNYVFQTQCRRRLVTTDVDKIANMLKEDIIQPTLLPCFSEVQNRMFHLANLTTTKKWEALCQDVGPETAIEDIDSTVLGDWRDFHCIVSRGSSREGQRTATFI